jgi:putative MATE family efflux protein
MMVSSAGEAAVSGVSLVNMLDNMLIVFFTALVSGGSVVVAQTLGLKEHKGVTEVAKQLLYAATFVAALLTVTVMIFRRPMLELLFGDAEADVMQNAFEYFSLVAISFPLLAINESVSACFRASGNSTISLLVSFFINMANICGNAVLIFVFDMGAKGAALATTIARCVGTVILLVLIHNKKHPVHIEHIFRYKPNMGIIRKILNIGVPNGIENTMFSFGRLLTQTLISMLGTTVIAANSVALSIANYQYTVTTAIAACAVPIVGRCIGAKKIDQAKYYSVMLLKLNYVLLTFVILLTMIFIRPIISTYQITEAGIELAI